MAAKRGVIIRPQKVLVYGPEGIGKSYFASKFPNPVFIDTEGSTYHMDVAREDKPSSWTMLIEQVKYYQNHPREYDTLVIDTMDWAEKLCIEHVCSTRNKKGIEDFGYGNGYTYHAEEFGRLLNQLDEIINVGMNVVLTAHAQLVKFEQPDEFGSYDRWELKLGGKKTEKRTAAMLKEWSDMILFANYKTIVITTEDKKKKAQGGKRIMYTTHNPCWDAKNRHDLLEELPFDFDQIKHCIPVRGSFPQTPAPRQDPSPAEPLNQDPPPTVEQQFDQMVGQDKPKKIVPADWSDIERKPKPNIPKALADLMEANGVTEDEIRRAVAHKGYYPQDTPVDKYDPAFIEGWAVAFWPQVFSLIKELRDIPY
jgi:hypothetical protein